MNLFYFRGENGVTNFGDELNPYLWPRLLPGAFDAQDGTQFVGIGTLLNDRLPPARRIVVFGAGVGYYGPPRRDGTWEVHCVRGPLSAAALGLPSGTAVTDPGALISRVGELPAAPGPRWTAAFMPHWQSEPDTWRQVCEQAGVGFIDPRWPTAAVLGALRRTDRLITEAMHGAIVADALRIPWVPVRTRPQIKTFKWEDWCRSLRLEYVPRRLPTVWPALPRAGGIRRMRRWAKLMLAARELASTARGARPFLSSDAILEERLDQLQDRLEQLRHSNCRREEASLHGSG